MDDDDVGVGERGDCTSPPLEAGECIGGIREGGRQYFDCDLPVEAAVTGAENLAHTAGAERSDDLVGAETLPDGQARHGAAGTVVPAPHSGGNCCSKAAYAITAAQELWGRALQPC